MDCKELIYESNTQNYIKLHNYQSQIVINGL